MRKQTITVRPSNGTLLGILIGLLWRRHRNRQLAEEIEAEEEEREAERVELWRQYYAQEGPWAP